MSAQSLKPCKSCEHPVSRTAKSCPSCGERKPYPIEPVNSAVAAAIGVAFVLLIASPCIVTSLTSDDSLQEQMRNGSYQHDQKYMEMSDEELASKMDYYSDKFDALDRRLDDFNLSNDELRDMDEYQDELRRLVYEYRRRNHGHEN